jgi:hypothetical protein
MVHNMNSMRHVFKNPLKQVHFCRNSALIGIHKDHVQRLGIDSATFFEEVPIPNGITLIIHKLSPATADENIMVSKSEDTELIAT